MSNKTIANNSSVDDFINNLDDPVQRSDSKSLVQLFEQITNEKPVMWGTAIIGFGSVNLTYASGRNLDWLKIGFSPRKGKLSLYVTFDAAKLTGMFPNLGKYSIGKGCIYINKLADVDSKEFEKLVKTAWEADYESPQRADGKEQLR
jgi:hypothetical protein